MTEPTPHEDARYARVLLLPGWKDLRRRVPPMLAGIVAIGIGIGCSVRADLGLSPWDVFHQGLADRLGMSIGTVVILVGLVVLVVWIPLRQRPGLGTLVNTLTIGLVADATLALLPEQQMLVVRVPLLVVALLAFAIGGGLYIGAGLGPGPRDGLMTAITARGLTLWKVRTVIELSALVVGWALGGRVGVGTVLIVFSIGPLTHRALRRFHLPVTDASPEVMGE